MRSDGVVQHDDGTPTGSRSTSFFIRGILGPDAWSIFMRLAGREVFRCSLSGRASAPLKSSAPLPRVVGGPEICVQTGRAFDCSPHAHPKAVQTRRFLNVLSPART